MILWNSFTTLYLEIMKNNRLREQRIVTLIGGDLLRLDVISVHG
jgi:hypothetical protein